MNSNHKVGDLVWNFSEDGVGILVKIWTEIELMEAGENYLEYHYEVYFPISDYRDRFKEIDIDYLKQSLIGVLEDETQSR
jgi:hypothetical protein